MPSRIDGLPDIEPKTNERVAFMVGQANSGGLKVLNVDIFERLERAVLSLARAIQRGTSVRDLQSYAVDGAILDIALGGIAASPPANAEYRNAGNVQVNIRLRNKDGLLATSEMLLSPGTSANVALHTGFQARTPSSAPSVLEVTVLE